jgi:hypothetical protein
MIPALSTVVFEDLPQSASSVAGNTKVNMRGNLYGVMFKRSDLASNLVAEQIKLAPGELINITDLEALNFSLQNQSLTNLITANEIDFSVNGRAKAVWHTDEVALKTDLAGRNKRELASILNNYPSVLSATTVIRPFWKSSFPSNTNRIKVIQLPVE